MKDKKKLGRILSLVAAYFLILCAVVLFLEDIKGLSPFDQIVFGIVFLGVAIWIIFAGDYKRIKEKIDNEVDYPNLD